MGSAQSYLTSENAATTIAAILVGGAIGIGYAQVGQTAGKSSSEEPPPKTGKRKKQGSGSRGFSIDNIDLLTSEAQAAALPDVIPGHFDSKPVQAAQDSSAQAAIPKSKKAKRRKAKGAAVEDSTKLMLLQSDYNSESSAQAPPKPLRNSKRSSQTLQPPKHPIQESEPSSSGQLRTSNSSIQPEGSWTQVGSRRSRKTSSHKIQIIEPDTSDARVTTSQTDDPSPVAEHTEDEHDSFLLQQSALQSSSRDTDLPGRKTLAEKLLPAPRKTGVDDMLETSDYPSISRVMRVTPLSEEPAPGFSLGDYEDIRLTTDGGENDADGEDDGWDVVTTKRPRRSNVFGQPALPTSAPMKAPETLTKRQRQNAQNRERQKTAKTEAENQRLATLANHKREQEKVRMVEQFGKSGRKASGGMKATVDERGKLVWE